MIAEIRKISVSIEETLEDMGKRVNPKAVKVAVAAVVKNPFAGQYVDDLSGLYDLGAEVADILTKRAQEALGSLAGEISAYGKGAIVGVDGEIEHAAALIHPKFGAPVRSAIGGGKAIIPSTKKVGGPGAAITMPLVNRDDIWVFDDMDGIEISIPDAPRSDEVVVALAFGVNGRPLKRIKGV
ncbi:amino acid synthesis family protein [Shinella zoogloeoides]|uniref:amino acid synthesis family protein n=1 Tax=Shinella zoogloeoides TaxID=352475 RepID=UPI000E64A770|nr:amino acid synthesis family protein [Shinella zoogloeoides]